MASDHRAFCLGTRDGVVALLPPLLLLVDIWLPRRTGDPNGVLPFALEVLFPSMERCFVVVCTILLLVVEEAAALEKDDDDVMVNVSVDCFLDKRINELDY